MATRDHTYIIYGPGGEPLAFHSWDGTDDMEETADAQRRWLQKDRGFEVEIAWVTDQGFGLRVRINRVAPDLPDEILRYTKNPPEATHAMA